MEQSSFDILLKQKLGDLQIDPPSGMWDSIQSHLPAISATIAAGVVGAGAVQAAKSWASWASWSSWSITGAVASAAVGLVAVSLVVFNRPDPTPLAKKQSVENIVPVADSLTQQPEELASVVYKKGQEIEYVVDTLNHVGPIVEREPSHPQPEPEPPTKVEPRKQTSSPFIKPNRAKRIHTIGLYAANIGGGSSGGVSQYGYAKSSYAGFGGNLRGIESLTSSEVASNQGVRHNAPIGAGVAFMWKTSSRLGIETGLTYTYLRSEYTIGTLSSTVNRTQELHYLGIPVNIKYDILNRGRVSFYGKAGGKLEWGVAGRNRYEKRYADGVMSQYYGADIDMKGVVPSVGVAVGGEYHLSRVFGLYFEPSANYYFQNSAQPESYRSQNKLSVNFSAGLRININ